MSDKAQPEKKTKKQNLKKYLAIIPIMLMAALAFSTAINFMSEDAPQLNEIVVQGETEDYTFRLLDEGTFGIYIYKNNLEIPVEFHLDPRNASEIHMDRDTVNQILNSQKIYLTFNPNQANLGDFAIAAADISRLTATIYGLPTVGAYTEDSNPVNPNVPIRTCNQLTGEEDITIIELRVMPGSLSKITKNNNCVRIITDNSRDLVMAADKLGMNLVGVKL